jgi:hypothetical protein
MGGIGTSHIILGRERLTFQRQGGRLWKAPGCSNGRDVEACGRLPPVGMGGIGTSRIMLGRETLTFQREGGSLWEALTGSNGRYRDLPLNAWKVDIGLRREGGRLLEGGGSVCQSMEGRLPCS